MHDLKKQFTDRGLKACDLIKWASEQFGEDLSASVISGHMNGIQPKPGWRLIYKIYLKHIDSSRREGLKRLLP
jgi:hypothetical protein